MKTISQSVKIDGKTLTLETGFLAPQANAAVTARLGDTLVLATVVSGPVQESLDYFPLYVEYMERLYAGGRIKGSRWVKRDGRPSNEAILNARLIDRSIRPLFPKDYRNEVQVVVTILSVDAENSPDVVAICAVAAALAISDIPWQGPVASLRIGFVPKEGKTSFLINPTNQDLEYSKLNLVVSATEKAVIMLEGGADNVAEETILAAIKFAQEEAGKIIKGIKDFQKKAGKKKQVFVAEKTDSKLVAEIQEEVGQKIKDMVKKFAAKEKNNPALSKIKDSLTAKYEKEKPGLINNIIEDLLKKAIREQTLTKGLRVDGRKPDEIRPIEIKTGVLPRTHGSAMFKRGLTQALTIATLGSSSLGQLIESMEGEETKRYMHHYFMPPFSLGETGRMGWPSRREIGHGALAERALEPVIPAEEKFPYAISVVSEIMSSNGSTSMASVCGSTLSLMDAGVPIKSPVSGIAMGLMIEGKKHVVLTDILGLEDFDGDMDFKAAGTKEGINAIQMDVKITDLSLDLIEETLTKAKKARIFILEKMIKALPASRAQVSRFAPKIELVQIPVEKIGEVIGPGGRVIREIIAETGAAIDVENDGKVSVSALDKANVEKAVAQIKALVREPKPGEIFEGTVKRIQPFGAFVEILPGKDGLVHVSRMSQDYVENPNEVVKIDQKVTVRVTEIDEMGRLNLSMILEPQKEGSKEDFKEDSGEKRPFRPRQRSSSGSRQPSRRRR